jgi:hypothetical protein
MDDLRLSEAVRESRKAYFEALPEICIERAQLVTELSLKNDLLKPRISVLDKARTYRHVLERRKAVVRFTTAHGAGMKPFPVHDTSLFAGSTTSKFKGVPLYPELMALSIWPELLTISRRRRNPYHLGAEEARELNLRVFPPWIDNTVLELARRRRPGPEIKLLERLVFFLASKANCISHTIPDFSKVLRVGLRGIAEEAEVRLHHPCDARHRDFYRAVVEVVHGLIDYSQRLAGEAGGLPQSKKTLGEERR